MKYVLASSSPRRRALLDITGLQPLILFSPDADESCDASLPPEEQAVIISERKALAAAPVFSPDDLIIAADTIVYSEGRVLTKPVSDNDAFRMLSLLSGKKHEVFTGITVMRGEKKLSAFERTAVFFRPLTNEEIRSYVETGEPRDKAGAYGIQGKGSLLISGIEGDYYNVVGFPLCLFYRMARSFGIELL